MFNFIYSLDLFEVLLIPSRLFLLSEFIETNYRPSLISRNQFSLSLFVWQPCPYLSCRHLANVWTLELLLLFFIFVCFFFPVACSFSVCYNFVRPFPLRLALRLQAWRSCSCVFAFTLSLYTDNFCDLPHPHPPFSLPAPASQSFAMLASFWTLFTVDFLHNFAAWLPVSGPRQFCSFCLPFLTFSAHLSLIHVCVCVRYWHSENMLWPELLVIYLKPFKWQNLHGRRVSGLPGIAWLQATLDYIIKSVSQAK